MGVVLRGSARFFVGFRGRLRTAKSKRLRARAGVGRQVSCTAHRKVWLFLMVTATPEKTAAKSTKATKKGLTFVETVIAIHQREVATLKADPAGVQTWRRRGPAIAPYNTLFRICKQPATVKLPAGYLKSLLKSLELALMVRDWYVRDLGDKAQIREDLLAQWYLVKEWDAEFDGVRKQVGAAIRAAGLLLKSERFTAEAPKVVEKPKRTVAQAIREDVGGDWEFSDHELNGMMAEDEH